MTEILRELGIDGGIAMAFRREKVRYLYYKTMSICLCAYDKKDAAVVCTAGQV